MPTLDIFDTDPVLLKKVQTGIWAMEQRALQRLLSAKAATVTVEFEHKPLAPVVATQAMAVEGAKLDVPRSAGAVVVLPLRGVIDQHRSWYAGVSVDELSDVLGKLVADESVGAIVLQWDSPGGNVFGVPEFTETIRSYRAVKPIYSLADAEAYSAAYWLGSAASKMFVIPSGGVGSIGVWTAHSDFSKAYEAEGIKVTLISSTPEKVEGNPWEPLSDAARASMQEEVDSYYGMFVDAVAKNRGLSANKVKADFGTGRTVMAQPALEAGMVDGIATLPELLGAVIPRKKGSARATAEARLAIAEVEIYD